MVIAPHACSHECGSSILMMTHAISTCLGYLEIPHHLPKLIYCQTPSYSFHHVHCWCLPYVSSTLAFHFPGLLRVGGLSSYWNLVAWWSPIVPLLPLAKATTRSFRLSWASITLRNNRNLLMSSIVLSSVERCANRFSNSFLMDSTKHIRSFFVIFKESSKLYSASRLSNSSHLLLFARILIISA